MVNDSNGFVAKWISSPKFTSECFSLTPLADSTSVWLVRSAQCFSPPQACCARRMWLLPRDLLICCHTKLSSSFTSQWILPPCSSLAHLRLYSWHSSFSSSFYLLARRRFFYFSSCSPSTFLSSLLWCSVSGPNLLRSVVPAASESDHELPSISSSFSSLLSGYACWLAEQKPCRLEVLCIVEFFFFFYMLHV